MADRVRSGLLGGKPHWRSRYVVTRHAQEELAVRASGFMTAINVGLNEVTLRAVRNGQLEYSVGYGRWAAFVVGLGAMLGIALTVGFLFWDIETQVSNKAIGRGLFWGFVVFWAAVWPWILIWTHRPFARKLLERIIREVDSAAQQARAADAPRR